MFPFALLLTPLSMILSFTTAVGVFVHDTRIDKATLTVMAVPAVVVAYQAGASMHLGGDLHTHSERSSLSQSVNDIKGQNPRVQPRSNSDKKYVTQKNSGLGHNPFDSYRMPLA